MKQHIEQLKPLDITFIQLTTGIGALVTALTPIISLLFMLVSIGSGLILFYKFFKNINNKKDE